VKAIALIVVIAACTPSAPDAPSFQEDVMPILAANCIRCHGYPSIGGAPDYFRLDSFDPVVIDDAGQTLDGAAFLASEIGRRVRSDDRRMPPRFPLDDYQIETLERWGAMMPPTRGEPRPDNAAPAMTVTETGRTGAIVHLVYDLHDPDRDLVVGELRAIGVVDRFVAPVQSGRIAVDWDTTGVPAGNYDLEARLDDGAGLSTTIAGTIGVP
jgi:hypothetical protein